MPAYTDLHCHVLPALDDGPADLATALGLVLSLEALGFAEFFPTPHQKANAWAPGAEQSAAAAATLRQALQEAGSQARIQPPAGENMWDELFWERQDGSYPCYPGQKAFLLELPPAATPPGLERQLFQFRLEGKLPVLAHVERYPDLAKNTGRLEALGRSTALLANLSSLGGMGGLGNRRLTRRLVKQGLVHALATDAHGPQDVVYCQRGLSWLKNTLGQLELDRLLSQNPMRIIAGDLPE